MKSFSAPMLLAVISCAFLIGCPEVRVEEQPEARITSLRGPYFGQTAPTDIPQLFLPGLVSSRDSSQYCISFLGKIRNSVFPR